MECGLEFLNPMLNHVLKNRNNLLFACQTAKSACSTKIKIMQIISEWPQFHSWLWSPQKNQLLDPLAIQVFWSIFLTWKCGRLIKETDNKRLFALFFFQNLLINPLFHDICPYFLWCVSKENGAINNFFPIYSLSMIGCTRCWKLPYEVCTGKGNF